MFVRDEATFNQYCVLTKELASLMYYNNVVKIKSMLLGLGVSVVYELMRKCIDKQTGGSQKKYLFV